MIIPNIWENKKCSKPQTSSCFVHVRLSLMTVLAFSAGEQWNNSTLIPQVSPLRTWKEQTQKISKPTSHGRDLAVDPRNISKYVVKPQKTERSSNIHHISWFFSFHDNITEFVFSEKMDGWYINIHIWIRLAIHPSIRSTPAVTFSVQTSGVTRGPRSQTKSDAMLLELTLEPQKKTGRKSGLTMNFHDLFFFIKIWLGMNLVMIKQKNDSELLKVQLLDEGSGWTAQVVVNHPWRTWWWMCMQNYADVYDVWNLNGQSSCSNSKPISTPHDIGRAGQMMAIGSSRCPKQSR